MSFRAPVSEHEFILKDILGYEQIAATEKFAEAPGDVASAILSEAGKMCDEVIAPLNRAGDLNPAHLENGVVRTAPGFKEGFEAIAEGGWVGMSADPEYDGMDLHFWYLFPNIGLAQFAGPGNLSLSQWLPVGPNRAYRKIVQLDLAEPTDPGMLERREKRMVWARDVLQPEDMAFIESVHQGMSQLCFEHGWYMIDPENEEISEVMVRHFHETYLAHMGESNAA